MERPRTPPSDLTGSRSRLRIRVALAMVVLVALWSGVAAARRMLGDPAPDRIAIDLGIVALPIALGLAARRPWSRTMALATCWLSFLAAPLVAWGVLSGRALIANHIDVQLPPAVTPEIAALLAWASVLVVSLAVYVLTNRDALQWFRIAERTDTARSGAGRLVRGPALPVLFLAVSIGAVSATAGRGRKLELMARAGGHVGAMATVGDLVFIDLGGTLGALDVSNPGRPTLVGRTAEVHSFSPADTFQRVATNGRIVYMAQGQGMMPDEQTVRAFDVNDPTRPRDLGYANGVDPPVDIVADDRGLYALVSDSGGGRLDVYDPAVPEDPTLLTSVSFRDPVNHVALAGGRVLVTTGARCTAAPCSASGALHVVEVSPPMAAHVLGSVDLPEAADEIAVDGSIAVVLLADGEMAAVDLSDPAGPTIAGRIALAPSQAGH